MGKENLKYEITKKEMIDFEIDLCQTSIYPHFECQLYHVNKHQLGVHQVSLEHIHRSNWGHHKHKMHAPVQPRKLINNYHFKDKKTRDWIKDTYFCI